MSVEYPEGFDQSVMQHKPICGVLAVALAAGVSYEVAHAACKRNMPKSRKRFRGATYNSQRDKALEQFGLRFTVFKTDFVGYTVKEFCQLVEGHNKIYLVEIRGHVMTLKDGFLIDQHICKPWQLYHHPRIKVKRIVRIDGTVWG